MNQISFRELFLYFLRLGFISFGGPAGQIAVMHTELVEKKKWVSESRFMNALNYCMFLPGPEAQQLATYIGWLLKGTWGGIVAGSFFVIPSFFIFVGLSWVYIVYGKVGAVQAVLYGVKPAVVAIVVYAVIRIGKKAIQNLALLGIALFAFGALYWLKVPFPLIILSAGTLGYVGSLHFPDYFAARPDSSQHRFFQDSKASPGGEGLREMARPLSGKQLSLYLTVGFFLWVLPMVLMTALGSWSGTLTQMGWFFTKAAFLTFGGAYAVLPYVAQNAILYYHWLRPAQMIDGLALGETTPGPLIMIVTFVGFVGAWQSASHDGMSEALAGALVATYFTFLPSFLFILVGAPVIELFHAKQKLGAVLASITAAVVGVILNLGIYFGQQVMILPSGKWDRFAVAIAVTSFIGMWIFKWGIVPVVLASGIIGWLSAYIAIL